jgi:hypothetical protein
MMMTVTPHYFFTHFNDQTMISPWISTGVILTNSCRLIFEWKDEMIHHHFQLIHSFFFFLPIRDETTSIDIYFLIILSGHLSIFYIVKCVNVSMIYALLSIHHSCLSRQAYRALEHHRLTNAGFHFLFLLFTY